MKLLIALITLVPAINNRWAFAAAAADSLTFRVRSPAGQGIA